MPDRPYTRRTSCLVVLALALGSACAGGQTSAPPLAKKLPADQRAFKAARSLTDPGESLAAMRAFVKDYPKSDRHGRAERAILATLLENFPERTPEIERQIKLLVKASGKGLSRYNGESEIAFQLAEAGPAGVDLPRAEAMARDAVKHLREPVFDKEQLSGYAQYKVPPPAAATLHKQFANARADDLAILADVYLREGKQALASAQLDEAYALDPLVDDVNSQRGRLALLQHHDALALEAFERAQLIGALSAADRGSMMSLYRQAHAGSDTGFVAEMDARYAQLFPSPFVPEKPRVIVNGHTVLLELFTGAACEPCVGADLAMDGLLNAYPRTDFVGLAFDEHVPDPDPLTNPDSAARAQFYDLGHTPTYILDGEDQPFYGATREDSHELYGKLAHVVDAQAALPTGVQLTLSARSEADSLIQAHATVTLPSLAELQKSLAPKPAPAPAQGGDKKPPPPPVVAAPAEPHLVVNFALVEDDVRYSGENGVRFHRMVVRALAKPADSGFPVSPAASSTLDASFDPAAISRTLADYLDSYERGNDRFGKIKFISKDVTMQPGHLAIAAWVQDTTSHRILQTALVPVGAQDGQRAAK